MYMKEIKQLQIKEQIANAIRNEILSGNMLPGEELVQEKVAEMLGVSRMPVREALQSLEQEGFLERLPNRHMKVVTLDDALIHDTFHLIAVMETEILSSYIKNQKKVLLRTDLMNEIANIAPEEELELHHSLLRGIQNPYVEQLFRKILDGYAAFVIQELQYDQQRTRVYLKDALASLQSAEKEISKEASISRTNLLNHCLEGYYEELANVLLEYRKRNTLLT